MATPVAQAVPIAQPVKPLTARPASSDPFASPQPAAHPNAGSNPFAAPPAGHARPLAVQPIGAKRPTPVGPAAVASASAGSSVPPVVGKPIANGAAAADGKAKAKKIVLEFDRSEKPPDDRLMRMPPAERLNAILAGLTQPIQPVEVTFGYRVAIVLVTIAMLTISLVYVGLIVGILAAALYYLFVLMPDFSRAGTGAVVMALLYTAPLAVALFLVLFLVKPLFVGLAHNPSERTLKREEEPLLFAFVERICAAVGAPCPSQINVTCDVNASASFRRGVASMLNNDLVLTIGLPLVAGLNLRQFAGVLAHEFGHFSQSAGMRLTYLIRRISFWFQRVVYQRDMWDVRLAIWRHSDSFWLASFALTLEWCVWASRGILWALMLVGNFVSSFMLRQMEYDADRYEARLAGSYTFESTSLQMRILGSAFAHAESDLVSCYRDGRLGDDLPRILLANLGRMPADLKEDIRQVVTEMKTGWLDTHPSDMDRVAMAHRENAVGVFQVDGPAQAVFCNFESLSKLVTRDYYQGVLRDDFDPRELHSSENLLARLQDEEDDHKALERFYVGQFQLLRPTPIPPILLPPNSSGQQLVPYVRLFRDRLQQVQPDYEKAYMGYLDAEARLKECEVAAGLSRAGIEFAAKDFNLTSTSSLVIDQALMQAQVEQRTYLSRLELFETTIAERLRTSLMLLSAPDTSQAIERVEFWRQYADQVTQVIRRLIELWPTVDELHRTHLRLALLLMHVDRYKHSQRYVEYLVQMAKEQFQHFETLHAQTETMPYPFEHAKGPLTVQKYLLPELPDSHALNEILNCGDAMLDRLPELLHRLYGRIARICEFAEHAVGLPPLEVPEKSPELKARRAERKKKRRKGK